MLFVLEKGAAARVDAGETHPQAVQGADMAAYAVAHDARLR